MEVDGFVLVPRPDEAEWLDENEPEYLHALSDIVDRLAEELWPLNCLIHDNPELAYKEYKTHDALVKFMQTRKRWTVTPSAFGLDTAWKAVYDTGRPGSSISFNAEMGMFLCLRPNAI